MRKVPALRFPNYFDNWEIDKLSNVVEIKNGKAHEGFVTESKKGFIIVNSRFISTDGRIRKYSSKNLSPAEVGDVLMVLSDLPNGKALGKCFFVNSDNVYAVNQRVSAFRAGGKIFPKFLYYRLNRHPYFLKFNDGVSQTHLLVDTVNNCPIIYPPNHQEQIKIVTVFTEIEKYIENLKLQRVKLEKYRDGIMKKIFTQELRFKDKHGHIFADWQNLSLGDVFERITQKNNTGNNNVLTISAQQGLINQEKFFTKLVSAKDVTGYYLLHNGDFAYNKSYSKGYPIGAIKRLNKFDSGVVSTLYICFRPKQTANGNYFEHFFNSGAANHSISRIVQEGARNHGLLNLALSDFFETVSFKVPSLEEQEVIAKFLTSIEELVSAKSQQVELAEKWKKGLLQKMFV
jgi:type I restriction enzyme S subunit